MEPVVVPMSIPLAFGISVTIGVVFGLYPPAAASMDPIEASGMSKTPLFSRWACSPQTRWASPPAK